MVAGHEECPDCAGALRRWGWRAGMWCKGAGEPGGETPSGHPTLPRAPHARRPAGSHQTSATANIDSRGTKRLIHHHESTGEPRVSPGGPAWTERQLHDTDAFAWTQNPVQHPRGRVATHLNRAGNAYRFSKGNSLPIARNPGRYWIRGATTRRPGVLAGSDDCALATGEPSRIIASREGSADAGRNSRPHG